MATRDRTNAFNILKEEFKNRRLKLHTGYTDDKDISLNPINSNIKSIEQLPFLHVFPLWMQGITLIDSNLVTIKSLVDSLSNVQPDLPTFDAHLQIEQEKKYDQICTDINRLIKDTTELVTNFGSVAKSMTSEEVKIKKNIQTTKKHQLQTITLQFRQKQGSYKTQLQRRSNIFKEWDGDEDFSNSSTSNSNIIELDFSDEQKQLVENIEQMANKRHKEIMEIVKSIKDLSSMFQDVGLLVQTQGDLLDQIEFNLSRAEESFSDATINLKEAKKSQKSGYSNICILLIILIMVIVFIVIAILRKVLI
ncbi:t-SNARE family protein [Tieghemostelium lacteum]|uniref:t-SNARE family protein n=1 Tax=Tieghemostelium lacteum TaxID=361077 RepID=A0A151Z536_TIELA|nr:t-SNARE family protein [Tieghemostelium lacteum]|eukprot:KYQ89089.1 t-SNARE family protein [Tieghemostelium lacteum]